ncbi:MAG: phospho-N-acetylmuramoyl-pentapeptide-transferase, partial [Candidatus Gallimonas sp.]
MIRQSIILLLLSFALSFVLCAAEIPLLRKLRTGQNILKYVKEHAGKGGTPTMGGLGFTLAAAVVAIAAVGVSDRHFTVALAVGGGYLLVGFLDDFLKKRRGDNLGLRPYQKIFFQTAVAALASVYCCVSGLTVLRIPFTTLSYDVGWWTFPLGLLVFLATVNSVNLTDGLDGLAGSVSAFFFLTFAVLLPMQGGDGALSSLSFTLTGALAAYLVFNVNRASVFMGDTGSLALGGFAACVALFSGNALLIPIVGIMFVVSSITVIIQV